MKRLENQNGFSMVQAMIALAIIAITTLSLVRIGEQSGRNQRGFFTAGDISQEIHKIERLLQDERSCNFTFNHASAAAMNSLDPGQIADIQSIRDIQNRAYVQIDNTINNANFVVTNINAQRGSDTLAWNQDMLRIQVDIERKQASIGASSISKFFLIHAVFNGNDFIRCYSRRSSINFSSRLLACELVHDGTYNSNTEVCATPFEVSFLSIGANNSVTTLEEHDYCSLSREKGEDGYKDSSDHECRVVNNPDGLGDKIWRLTAMKHEARSTNCTMVCFKFSENAENVDGGDDTGPGGTPPEQTMLGVAIAICDKLAECYTPPTYNILPNECINNTTGILGNEHFETAFGLTAVPNRTFWTIYQQEETGILSPNPTNLANCLNEIEDTLLCTSPEVVNADPGSGPSPDYLKVQMQNIIPNTPASCNEIF